MWNSYQRICFALLYATFASEYGYAGLWNSFSSYYVRAVMRSYCWCYLFYLRDLGLRDLFLFFFVFLVYGLIRLVWQPFQLRLRRWRLCGPGASVRAPVGRPARQALRWDSYCSSTRKSGRRV